MGVTLQPMGKKNLKRLMASSVEIYTQQMLLHDECHDYARAKQAAENEIYSHFSSRHPLQPYQNQLLMCAYDAEKKQIVGNLWVSLKRSRERSQHAYAFLQWIDVKETLRGQGYAKKFLSRVEEMMREKNMPYIELSVFVQNYPARKLYQKLGYNEFATATYGHAITPTRIRMRKYFVAQSVAVGSLLAA